MNSAVPIGWENYNLGDICYFQEGPGLRNWQYATQGYPFINIRCIREGFLDLSKVQYISEEEAFERYQHFFLNEGDYVLSSSGTLGRMAKIKKKDLPLMLNTSVIRFRATDEARLYQDFLPHYLQSPDFVNKITEESQGSAQVNFGPTHLKLVECCLPPLPEQQKIAAILSTVDDVIEKTRAQIAKLKDLKTGMMQELLSKGIGHTEFKESPVGLIPVGWEVRDFLDIFEFKNGVNKGGEAFGHGVPIISYRNVYDGGGIYESSIKNLVAMSAAELPRFSCNYGDVFFTRTSETPDEIGYANVYLGRREDVVYSGFVIRARQINAVLNVEFCKFAFQSEVIRKQMIHNSKYTTRAGISSESLGRLKISVPPIGEQVKIAGSIGSISGRIDALSNKLILFSSVKKALMQDLLTGKVRVKINDKESVVA